MSEACLTTDELPFKDVKKGPNSILLLGKLRFFWMLPSSFPHETASTKLPRQILSLSFMAKKNSLKTGMNTNSRGMWLQHPAKMANDPSLQRHFRRTCAQAMIRWPSHGVM